MRLPSHRLRRHARRFLRGVPWRGQKVHSSLCRVVREWAIPAPRTFSKMKLIIPPLGISRCLQAHNLESHLVMCRQKNLPVREVLLEDFKNWQPIRHPYPNKHVIQNEQLWIPPKQITKMLRLGPSSNPIRRKLLHTWRESADRTRRQ